MPSSLSKYSTLINLMSQAYLRATDLSFQISRIRATDDKQDRRCLKVDFINTGKLFLVARYCAEGNSIRIRRLNL